MDYVDGPTCGSSLAELACGTSQLLGNSIRNSSTSTSNNRKETDLPFLNWRKLSKS